MPRYYAADLPEFQDLNIFSNAGAANLAVGLVLPVFYPLYSLPALRQLIYLQPGQ